MIFDQPGAAASTLNHIWSQDASTIAGQLKAIGQVYLINQNGVIFANGAQVNVGGLVASTLNIKDSTYLGGLLTGNMGAIGTLSRRYSKWRKYIWKCRRQTRSSSFHW